jgi:hypothetical protein
VRAVSDGLHRASLDAETMAVALDSAREACAELETAPGSQGASDPVTIVRVTAAE